MPFTLRYRTLTHKTEQVLSYPYENCKQILLKLFLSNKQIYVAVLYDGNGDPRFIADRRNLS